MREPVRVGAVMYDPKVSVIWEIIGDFFEAQGVPLDTMFFSTYELQVTALVEGSVDIAWNSPLAWLDLQRRSGGRCRAIAMRDTDRDRQSYLVAKSGGGVASVAGLKRKTLAVGALDSPQATLIPIGLVRQAGLDPARDLSLKRFNLLVGKHGDHVGGEQEAFRAVQAGGADACAMLDLNWEAWTADGTVDRTKFTVVAKTDRFDHCVFSVCEDFPLELERRWLDALFAMKYDDPSHREMMNMEGLKAWLPGRTTGFGPLTAAVEAEGFFERNQSESEGTSSER